MKPGPSPLSATPVQADTEVEMFVYYFVHVDRPIEETRQIVLGLLDGLADAADIAYREGEGLRMRAGPGARVIAKTVRLEIGSPFQHDGEVAIPLSWEATGPTELFPTVDAELILAAHGPGLTQISFRGSYRPPLGGLGEALDKALLHRVAEATVKHFVDRVGAAVIGWPREAAPTSTAL